METEIYMCNGKIGWNSKQESFTWTEIVGQFVRFYPVSKLIHIDYSFGKYPACYTNCSSAEDLYHFLLVCR